MQYRKLPLKNRNLMYLDNRTDSLSRRNLLEEIKEIPLPNEVEIPESSGNIRHHSYNSSTILNFINRIKIDDLILLGLIFLLMDEGVEDDFLIVMLLFIFFSGFESTT